MEERIVKKSRILNFDDLLQLSTEEWHTSINAREDYVSKDRLQEYGVLVVSNFLNCSEVDILNGCVKIAKLASKYETFQEREISGGIMTIDIPISHFSKEDMRFSSGTTVFQESTRKIRKMIGPEYSLVGDISILTTPNGAEKQFIHSDCKGRATREETRGIKGGKTVLTPDFYKRNGSPYIDRTPSAPHKHTMRKTRLSSNHIGPISDKNHAVN
jgi:hypothetical protein